MKHRFLSLLIAIFMVIGTDFQAYANELEELPNELERFSVASEVIDDNVDNLAIQFLDVMKAQFYSNSGALGFRSDELLNSYLGNSFTIYVFDKSGKIVSNDIQSYPLIYKGKIIGILDVHYDESTLQYSYTFGKAYADSLNLIRHKKTVDLKKNLIIGRMGDKLFITDYKNIDIILDKIPISPDKVSYYDLREICTELKTVRNVKYKFINEKLFCSYFNRTKTNVMKRIESNHSITRTFPNPLPVPHVQQTGTCGIAAWAAVLNYRFGTSYTNDSLSVEMANGYNNDGDGIPRMGEYRDFANDKYNAGCTLAYSPLSHSGLRNAINSGRPVMGAWYSGSGSDKNWHAIIITGCDTSHYCHIYTLKNPWYNYTQTIGVTNTQNVIYSDAGYTWKLSQSVY